MIPYESVEISFDIFYLKGSSDALLNELESIFIGIKTRIVSGHDQYEVKITYFDLDFNDTILEEMYGVVSKYVEKSFDITVKYNLQ